MIYTTYKKCEIEVWFVSVLQYPHYSSYDYGQLLTKWNEPLVFMGLKWQYKVMDQIVKINETNKHRVFT